MKNCNTISINLAKSVFQVGIINAHGKISSNKAIPRKRLLPFSVMKVEGIGPVIATALVGNFGDKASEFKNGRDMAAVLGLTPNQHSSGGKAKLGAITKRGDKYLRTLLVNGATSVINALGSKTDPKSLWLKKLLKRKPDNKVRIALANKMARIAWAILAKGETYKPELACAIN